MKSFDQLAQAAYAAYCKKSQRNDQEGLAGHALSWEELDEGTRQCWIEAAKQLWAEFAAFH